ncbi:hypothetical protein JCM16418A_04470 [Paenibacillus pini]
MAKRLPQVGSLFFGYKTKYATLRLYRNAAYDLIMRASEAKSYLTDIVHRYNDL